MQFFDTHTLWFVFLAHSTDYCKRIRVGDKLAYFVASTGHSLKVVVVAVAIFCCDGGCCFSSRACVAIYHCKWRLLSVFVESFFFFLFFFGLQWGDDSSISSLRFSAGNDFVINLFTFFCDLFIQFNHN